MFNSSNDITNDSHNRIHDDNNGDNKQHTIMIITIIIMIRSVFIISNRTISN